MSLVIAVPSKGRLMENAHAYFARAGITLRQPGGGRDYRGLVPEISGIEIAYLSAAEIAGQLASGGVHLGVTGEDLVRELIPDSDERVLLLDGLGFGNQWGLVSWTVERGSAFRAELPTGSDGSPALGAVLHGLPLHRGAMSQKHFSDRLPQAAHG